MPSKKSILEICTSSHQYLDQRQVYRPSTRLTRKEYCRRLPISLEQKSPKNQPRPPTTMIIFEYGDIDGMETALVIHFPRRQLTKPQL
jgi:hypothetical protein